MEYAAPRLTRSPSRQSILVPLVALVLGAGVATGTYALVDNGNTTDSKVIVVQRPGPHAAEIAGKNEAATAAAIGGTAPQTASHPNEAATAVTISKSQSGVEGRGSKASSTGIPSPAAAEAQASADFRAQQLREDPHGPAVSLRNP